MTLQIVFISFTETSHPLGYFRAYFQG